jgi:hypothetical protein
MTVNWHPEQAIRVYRERARRALYRIAGVLLDEANETVPHRSGDLMRSGKASVNDTGEPKAMVAYGAGNLASAYAVRQHEDTRLHHPDGRRAEWLRRTLDENRSRYRAWLKRELT